MIRNMQTDDIDAVRALWMTISGFGIRSLDDTPESVLRFLERNPETCVVAVEDNEIVGAILCGHDGRRGCFYHVCVRKDFRRRGIGRQMALFCLERLRKEQINKVCLNAYVINEAGNAFWKSLGWTLRSDMNYYEFSLNEANVTVFNP